MSITCFLLVVNEKIDKKRYLTKYFYIKQLQIQMFFSIILWNNNITF